MSNTFYSAPLEPLVEQNSFRTKGYEPQPIPSFLEAKDRLPVPMLPEHPEWVEMYWRAWEIAWSNLHRPKPNTAFVADYIDTSQNEHVFMWDSCFMAQFGIYGRRVFNFMGTLDNFYAKQHDNGFICRQINTQNGQDLFYPFDPNGTGPNILAWAEWRYFRQTGDDSRLAQVFWPLLAFHRWYKAYRTWPGGMYWATGLSSGMNNQPRVPDSMHHHRHWTWVDTNMQTALNCLILGQIATLLQENEFLVELNEERTRLLGLINEKLWNPEMNFYQDMDGNGRFSRVKTIGAYWGLLDKDLVPEKRLIPFLQHLRENWGFKLPHRIPSMSADSEGYNAESGNFWRGGVWSPTNFMVLKGLRNANQHSLAHEIAINHLQNVWEVYRRTDTFWDYYAPETAAPGEPAKTNYVGWTGLTPISILLEDIIGIGVDWPQRRVYWDRRLETSSMYGVSDFPLGLDGSMDLFGDNEKVVVTTDVPFTLTIRDETQTLQMAVPAGTMELSLT